MSLKHFKSNVLNIEAFHLHFDTVRDLKQTNSLLTSIVYPILEDPKLPPA